IKCSMSPWNRSEPHLTTPPNLLTVLNDSRIGVDSLLVATTTCRITYNVLKSTDDLPILIEQSLQCSTDANRVDATVLLTSEICYTKHLDPISSEPATCVPEQAHQFTDCEYERYLRIVIVREELIGNGC